MIFKKIILFYQDSEQWSQEIASAISKHFNKEYRDDTEVFRFKKSPNIIKRKISERVGRKKISTIYTVHRKRHGLAHGMRQGFLAVDIVETLNLLAQNKAFPFDSAFGNEFASWASKKMAADSDFLAKVQLVSSFQRTGRESEAGSQDYPDLYKQYERNDAFNFESYAKRYLGPNSLFKNDDELQTFKESLLHATADEGAIDANKNHDLFFLRRIASASHMLDLRRLPAGDSAHIQKVLLHLFFNSDRRTEGRVAFIEKLWNQAGKYIQETGDRDMMTGQFRYRDRFFILSNKPEEMARKLYKIRKAE